MGDINNRIMLIMREKNLNKNSLSKLLGISQPALKKIEDNLNAPSFKLLFEILSNFKDISADWLMTGEGPMYVENTTEKAKIDSVPIEIYKESQAQLRESLTMLSKCQEQISDLILILKNKQGNNALQERDVGCADVG